MKRLRLHRAIRKGPGGARTDPPEIRASSFWHPKIFNLQAKSLPNSTGLLRAEPQCLAKIVLPGAWQCDLSAQPEEGEGQDQGDLASCG